jgi:tryptophan-rich sensory protein
MKYIQVSSPYEILGLFPFFGFSYLSAYFTSSYTRSKDVIDRYNNLNAPLTTRPPPWIYTFAWMILYALTGFAGFYVWQKVIEYKPNGDSINEDVDRTIGNDVIYWQYLTMLFLHAATWILGPIWFNLFFGKNRLGASLSVILLYLACSYFLMILGYIMDYVVGILYTPLAIWMTFATVMNIIFYKFS